MKKQSGVGLIEVLITALVLAIGLVGLAGLNISSLQATHSSYYRSIATMIATDAEERAWLTLGATGALTTADLATIEGALTADWSFTQLPNLTIAVTEVASSVQWMDIDIVVTWDERRFVSQQGESVGYRTRVPITGI